MVMNNENEKDIIVVDGREIDLNQFATKKDLENFATKQDIRDVLIIVKELYTLITGDNFMPHLKGSMDLEGLASTDFSEDELEEELEEDSDESDELFDRTKDLGPFIRVPKSFFNEVYFDKHERLLLVGLLYMEQNAKSRFISQNEVMKCVNVGKDLGGQKFRGLIERGYITRKLKVGVRVNREMLDVDSDSFVRVPQCLLDDETVKRSVLESYMAIEFFAEGKSMCSPSYGELTEVSSLSKCTLINGIDDLIQRGLVKKVIRGQGGKPSKSNIYHLLLSNPTNRLQERIEEEEKREYEGKSTKERMMNKIESLPEVDILEENFNVTREEYLKMINTTQKSSKKVVKNAGEEVKKTQEVAKEVISYVSPKSNPEVETIKSVIKTKLGREVSTLDSEGLYNLAEEDTEVVLDAIMSTASIYPKGEGIINVISYLKSTIRNIKETGKSFKTINEENERSRRKAPIRESGPTKTYSELEEVKPGIFW